MADDCCKIGRATRRHELQPPGDAHDAMDEYLVARWRGDGDYDATGIRPLVAWFNKQLLRGTYIEHGRRVTTTRIESEYDALTGDDEVAAREVMDDLAHDGIDGEELQQRFATRSTMARHLKQCLGASKSTGREGERDWEAASIDYTRQNARDHATDTLETLANKGKIPGATEADLSVQFYLTCPECTTRVEVETALRRGYICDTHLGRSD
ncbi:MAG: rod-determining factor RdfA [Halobacteriaceae archaeon]